MKQLLIYLFFFVMILFIGCDDKINYETIMTYQDNSIPEPDIDVSDSTRVLVVVPHADDETIAGGLISFFNEQGASIHLLTLCDHNDTRVKELNCAADRLGIEQVEIAGFINNTWEDVMQSGIRVFRHTEKYILELMKLNGFQLLKQTEFLAFSDSSTTKTHFNLIIAQKK